MQKEAAGRGSFLLRYKGIKINMNDFKDIIFRASAESDAEAVSRIYDFARDGFRESGIPQWMEGEPNKNTFLEDVKNRCSYVIECRGEVAATSKIILYEPVYDKIYNGEWRSDSYIAVHRVAVSGDYRRMGLAGMLMREAERLAVSIGREAVRIDTHEKNFKMRAMLEKNGYVKRGVVLLADGSPRFAYEKLVNSCLT